MADSSVYDSEGFFELYRRLRSNPLSLNEMVEKPTMLSLLPDLQHKRVLDLGCGYGEHMGLYLQRGAAFVAGIDLSQQMLDQARLELKKLCQNQPHFWDKNSFALYHLAMEQTAQLAEEPFDVITSSFAFHYVADFSALLSALSAKLRPGGVLLFSQEHPIVTAYLEGARWEKNAEKVQTAYRLNYYRDEGERQRNWFGRDFTTYHRTMATIVNALVDGGFRIEKMAEPMLAESPQLQAEFKDLRHRPLLLFIRARKI
ncbi:methyltransferase family protein [Mesocricetibacter intestinalis]|uniref:Methyltransferase family protein n=1 Tax=Mesocricetibacter intestinalis TaxID=1521930 RepID=A0A4R6VFJ3_9PAST|nr:class I SAM-dependent methyltransferase [Mesocricetibacter intestinalis]TDQ59531.1 methyltransferase family protein [Mesocricetibacter intestinalis]